MTPRREKYEIFSLRFKLKSYEKIESLLQGEKKDEFKTKRELSDSNYALLDSIASSLMASTATFESKSRRFTRSGCR